MKKKQVILCIAVSLAVVFYMLFFYDNRTTFEKVMFIDGEPYYLAYRNGHELKEKVSDDEAEIIRKWIKSLTIVENKLYHFPYLLPVIEIEGKEYSVGFTIIRYKSEIFSRSQAYDRSKDAVMVFPPSDGEFVEGFAYLAVSNDQELGRKINEMHDKVFREKYPDWDLFAKE